MKRILLAAAWIIATLPAHAANVGVSISVGQPGFYGQIDIGSFPRPLVINPQPVIYGPVMVGVPPIYLRVPPNHSRHWRKYCHQYGACGRPVYFVQDSWYQDVYVPYYRERREYRDDRHDEGRDWGRRHDDRGRERDHEDRGRGHGRDHDRD